MPFLRFPSNTELNLLFQAVSNGEPTQDNKIDNKSDEIWAIANNFCPVDDFKMLISSPVGRKKNNYCPLV